MKSKIIFELDAVSTAIYRSLHKSLQERMKIDLMKLTGGKSIESTPKGIRLIEAIVQRYLMAHSDTMETDFRAMLEDINNLEQLKHDKDKSKDPDASDYYEYTDIALRVFNNPKIHYLYGILIKVVSGSSFNVQHTIEDYLRSLLPETILNNWIESMDDLTSGILDDIALCDDDWWVINFNQNNLFSAWAVLDVFVSGDVVIVHAYDDYRLMSWEMMHLLRKDKEVKEEFINKLDIAGELSKEARYYLNRQLELDAQYNVEFNINHLMSANSYHGGIPDHIIFQLTSFFSRMASQRGSVRPDVKGSRVNFIKEQERARRTHFEEKEQKRVPRAHIAEEESPTLQ